MVKTTQICTLILVALLSFGVTPTSSAQTFSFGYNTSPGEVLQYTGEVTTTVEVPWHQPDNTGTTKLFYETTLTTHDDQRAGLTRLEDTIVTLFNGEKMRDQVTYHLLAPDFMYIQEEDGMMAGMDFFPPAPIEVGATWTVTGDLPIPTLGAVIPVTTKYVLEEMVSLENDQVAIISQSFAVSGQEVEYMKMPMAMGMSGDGFSLWSMNSGDYVGRYVISTISLALPEALGQGELLTSIERSEIVAGGNRLPSASEEYMAIYLDYLLK